MRQFGGGLADGCFDSSVPHCQPAGGTRRVSENGAARGRGGCGTRPRSENETDRARHSHGTRPGSENGAARGRKGRGTRLESENETDRARRSHGTRPASENGANGSVPPTLACPRHQSGPPVWAAGRRLSRINQKSPLDLATIPERRGFVASAAAKQPRSRLSIPCRPSSEIEWRVEPDVCCPWAANEHRLRATTARS